MRTVLRLVVVAAVAVPCASFGPQAPAAVDGAMVARIRAEGLERSRVMDTASYITDVLGARLTLSDDMTRAQAWAKSEMERMGLTNVVIEPFMEYGTTWDNEYVSLHLLEPDYQPMVGYPLSHTPGTGGRRVLRTVIADVRTKKDLDPLRGRLAGAAVLASPPVTLDLARYSTGVARWTDAELAALERAEPPTPTPAAVPAAANPDLLRPEDRTAFFKAEGVAVVLQSDSGWPGAVRGFARPGTRDDRWSRQATLASRPIVAVTPEHYNRMYRILQRGIPVTIEVEVRNRIGATVEQAKNVLGELAGGDLRDEVVMLGAHFDTWHASPNASDNTSGAAVMLEAMRILRAVGARPRRTIRLALWAGEEQGLHGSREYVLKTFGDPASPRGVTPAYDRFSAYFNQDYGPGQYRGIYLQGNAAAREIFTAWMRPFRDLGMTTVTILGVGSTDHLSFDRVGLPGFQFLQDRVGGTGGHTNLDFLDTIPAEDMKRNATIVASFVYHAAMSDARIPRKPITR